MSEITKAHVGLDVHKDTITVALAEAGRQAAKVLCTMDHDVPKLVKLLRKRGEASALHVVYEAGPTGYGLQRALQAKGYTCEVVAPSQIPRRPGTRVKTDSRDSVQLAECSRAGLLRSVWVPDPGDEAIRDLARAREDAVHMRTQLRQQLKGFLLRHGIGYEGKTSWTQKFERWLGTLSFEGPAQMAFTEYWLATKAGDQRVERLSQSLQDAIKGWRFEPVVKALQALRGIDVISAVGLTAEIGDFRRFDHPRKLMGYLGLVPSEHSSGQCVQRGSITKTGNAHARTLLTEAAWHYRFGARIGEDAARRQSGLSEAVRATAWKAQLRLTRRFAVLNGRGVQRNKVCVAVARELAGFVWAVARIGLDEHLASLGAQPAANATA
ncbi:IS110 family transposase [Piscinibacter sp.]|uniref:IS110 family transposase n=1 Tax=Piscinibacter sp. TaxID=1903157 RepID=UPI001B7B622B|nr:IS110 family transposase [Piscinibacter sp.]MBP5989959.1 IS110 family transposase [Piscinibacter sp.]MBP6026656.1 IS110 family transposase [Piscinibacter sp.]